MKNQDAIFTLDFNMQDMPIMLPEDKIKLDIEKDIQNAHSEGYSKGFSRGFEEGSIRGELGAFTQSERNKQTAFVNIYDGIHAIIKQESIYEQKLSETSISLATTIIKKVLPHYISKHGADEMEHAIRYILSTILDHKDINIFLSSSSMEDIYERIEDIHTYIPNKITLNTDDALKEWECRIEWQGGGARWSQPDLLESIQELFDRYIQSTNSDKEPGK
jgi:flagellar biosynthesis/type III secretory pathway protein FliH